MDYFKEKRKSFIEIGNIYFWTATINSWIKLLEQDALKQIIIESLFHLSEKEKIKVYAFVIMPNHIHLIWQIGEKNGKETAQGSFLEFTAHEFKKYLKTHNPVLLQSFAVKAHNKKFEFWQRDPLAFQLIKRETALQKLDYLPVRQAFIIILWQSTGSFVLIQRSIIILLHAFTKPALMTLIF